MAAVDRICETCHKVSTTEDEICPDDGGKLTPITKAEDFVGRVIDDKLTLTGVIGRGGMGVVYRALQHSMDREVAVKLLHPSYSDDTEAVKRFLHEAKAASRLDHPNVITVFDFGRTEDGLLYLVMELLKGEELATTMEGARLGAERSVHVLTQVCDAVHHAHERGLVHRDLKPENVFLLSGSALRRDFVKVLDFGIAMMRSYEGIERLTQTGSVCGTPGYMSPEQILGDEVDRRSDVYALGVMAFEMITGTHPFPADTAMRQLLAHLETAPPTFAEVGADVNMPPAIELVVMKALQKEADARFPTAMAFGDALVAAMSGRDPGELLASDPVMAVVEGGPPRNPTTQARAGARSQTQGPARSSKRGFADTMIATDQVTLAPRSGLRRFGPYALVAAVAIAAVAILLTRGDPGTDATSPDAGHVTSNDGAAAGSASARPAPPSVRADTRASGGVVAADEAPKNTPDAAAVAEAADAGSTDEADAASTAMVDDVEAPSEDAAAAVAAVEEDTTPPAPAAPAPIRVTSTPEGAMVEVAGKAIGTTPVDVPRPPEGMRWEVVFTKSGRRDVTRFITAEDDALDVTLPPKRRPTSGGTTAGHSDSAKKDGGETDNATGPAPPPMLP